jgi:di/tripeptidase
MIPGLISILIAGGGVIAKNMLEIRTLDRKQERANVDRYRRTLEHFRAHYATSGECVIRNKRILRELPEDDPLVPVAEGMIDQCNEEKEEWRERIENYVEENKHMGYD